ncbi:MAG: hypothetical protein ACHQE6_00970 [Solirubrobacterales bacterium]
MTHRRAPARIVVRGATEDDADTLEGFRCSTGPWYERDVEEYVRARALREALEKPSDYRLLLVLDDGRLTGCMAHALELLIEDAGPAIVAARLHLLAIAIEDQGRRLEDGRRRSDLIVQALIFDAFETRETEVLTAVVARENLRSITLCERNGLRSQVSFDRRHIRLTGHFARR